VIGCYAVLAGRIRQDIAELDRVVARVERPVEPRRQHAADLDLLLDAAALILHDFYTGLERIFSHIATDVEQSPPTGPDWHRERLRQMTVDVPGLRPAVLTSATAGAVDEFLRFRHIVRHIYAFQLDPARVKQLAGQLRPTFAAVTADLTAFAAFLDGLSHDA
jgi:ribonuclease HepT-like protein